MKPAPLTYYQPETLAEVVEVLATEGDAARILAGGQSLMPLLNERRCRPKALIDINMVTDSVSTSHDEENLIAGPLVRQSEVLDNKSLLEVVPLLGLAIPLIGVPQTRNRGTLCGSIAYADPMAELPLALLVAGGQVTLASNEGTRQVEIDHFLDKAFAPNLTSTELVSAIHWPIATPNQSWGFAEYSAGSTLASAAVRLTKYARGDEIRIGFSGTLDRPRVITLHSEGEGIDTRYLAHQLQMLTESMRFIDDPEVPSTYRCSLAMNLAHKAIAQANTAREPQ